MEKEINQEKLDTKKSKKSSKKSKESIEKTVYTGVSSSKKERPSLFDPDSFSVLKTGKEALKDKSITKKIYGKSKGNLSGNQRSKVYINRSSLKTPILIIAGEHSGDLLGGELVKNLRSLGFTNFFGTGGHLMEKQGVDLLERVENMTTVGVIDALKAYKKLKKLAKELYAQVLARGIQTAILIDYPGFNLRFAPKLKKMGIRVIYMVSPQLWAWHYSRIKIIKKNIELMLVLFPFEEEMYTREGVKSHCIGHPSLYRLPLQLIKEKSLYGELASIRKKNWYTIGLFPGSRSSEIKAHLSDMLQAADLFHKEFPKSCFLVAGVNTQMESYIRNVLKKYTHIPIVYDIGRSLRMMEESDVLIMASGTVVLEGTYFKKPMLVVYRTGWINFFIASIVLRVRCLNMINILAQKQIVSEFLQSEITPKTIYIALKDMLQNKEYKDKISEELWLIYKSLTMKNPARKAAFYIADLLGKRR